MRKVTSRITCYLRLRVRPKLACKGSQTKLRARTLRAASSIVHYNICRNILSFCTIQINNTYNAE